MADDPILLLSIFTFIVSFLLFALANSFIMLLISRIVAGLAIEVSIAQAYFSDITSEKKRAGSMASVGASARAGFIIGPALGGVLSIYGCSVAGFADSVLALINLVFAF